VVTGMSPIGQASDLYTTWLVCYWWGIRGGILYEEWAGVENRAT
jgi:hypothetical protein